MLCLAIAGLMEQERFRLADIFFVLFIGIVWPVVILILFIFLMLWVHQTVMWLYRKIAGDEI
jgi:site-specific recombinase